MKRATKSRKSHYDKNFIAVAQKVFAVLEALSQQPKSGVPLEEITQISGLPKTTVFRLLYSMHKLGFAEQDPDTGLYSLSGKFFELGTNALPYQRLTVLARPLMQTLLLSFGESVNVAVPKLGGAIYIAVAESPKPHRVAASIGGLLFSPLHLGGEMYCCLSSRRRNGEATQPTWNASSDSDHNHLAPGPRGRVSSSSGRGGGCRQRRKCPGDYLRWRTNFCQRQTTHCRDEPLGTCHSHVAEPPRDQDSGSGGSADDLHSAGSPAPVLQNQRARPKASLSVETERKSPFGWVGPGRHLRSRGLVRSPRVD